MSLKTFTITVTPGSSVHTFQIDDEINVFFTNSRNAPSAYSECTWISHETQTIEKTGQYRIVLSRGGYGNGTNVTTTQNLRASDWVSITRNDVSLAWASGFTLKYFSNPATGGQDYDYYSAFVTSTMSYSFQSVSFSGGGGIAYVNHDNYNHFGNMPTMVESETVISFTSYPYFETASSTDHVPYTPISPLVTVTKDGQPYGMVVIDDYLHTAQVSFTALPTDSITVTYTPLYWASNNGDSDYTLKFNQQNCENNIDELIADMQSKNFTIPEQFLAMQTANEYKNIDITEHFKWRVKAFTGYHFSPIPSYAATERGQSTSGNGTESGDYYVFQTPLTVDYNSAYIITAIAIETVAVQSDIYGFLHVYKPTIEQLIKISRFYWNFFNPPEGGTWPEYSEYRTVASQLIKRLYRCLVDIPTDGLIRCLLGGNNTGIDVGKVVTSFHKVNIGSVFVEPPYERDSIIDSRVRMYLPFHGFESLDADIVLGNTLNVTYSFNHLSGVALIEIYCNGTMIRNVSTSYIIDVPFNIGTDSQETALLDYNSSIDTDNLTPYVLIEYPVLTSNDDIEINGLRYNVKKRLLDVHGYTIIDNPHLIVPESTKDELDEICQLLANGVILP